MNELSRDEYIAQVQSLNQIKKSILAVKNHLEAGNDIVIAITGSTAKYDTINGKRIAELGVGKGFITNQLGIDLEKVETGFTDLDAAFKAS